MDGFKRPVKKRQAPPVSLGTPRGAPPSRSVSEPSPLKQGTSLDTLPPIDIDHVEATTGTGAPRKKWLLVAGAIVAVLALVGVVAGFWVRSQLQPVNTGDNAVQKVEIKEGSTLAFVADRLEERGLIRNSLAFKLYVGAQGKQSAIKAGTCHLSPAYSAKAVLDKISEGCHDFKSVTFYPGATLEPSLYAKTKADREGKEFQDMSIRASLRAVGYADGAITKAFQKKYDSPLFAGKPTSQGYEGYIFGETYYVDTDASAEEVLQTAFDHMYSIVKSENLESKFQSQGLNLYEGITLASIVGRELDCEGKPTPEREQRCYEYQQQIAQVFYNRLARDMSLGSDVTSIYASDKEGVAPSITIDSPYNTRKHPGLTPGPIATPGKLALLATANPKGGDGILFFLAGDDGLIYFAKDGAGHEANISNHCKIGCGDL